MLKLSSIKEHFWNSFLQNTFEAAWYNYRKHFSKANSVCIGVLNQKISNMFIIDINVHSESCLCNHLAFFLSNLDFFKKKIFLTKKTQKVGMLQECMLSSQRSIHTKQNSLRKQWNSRNWLLWNWSCPPWHSHGEYTLYGYLNIYKI